MCQKITKLLVVLTFVSVLVTSEKASKSSKRKGKFLNFNTSSKDIDVSLEFSIPFLTIPVQKTMDAAFGGSGVGFPLVDLNMGSLVLGGAAVLGAAVVLPLLLKTFVVHHPQNKYARLVENTEFSADYFLDFTNHLLMDNSILQRCALRIACWTAQKASDDQANKLLNQVTTNAILASIINSTAVEEAISSGRQGRDCMVYTPCPLKDEHLPMLMSSISNLGKR